MSRNPSRRPLVAGNWKMHRTVRESAALAEALVARVEIPERVDAFVAPTFTALSTVRGVLAGTRLGLGAQDVHWEPKQGAFTGEISAAMLEDVGCTYGIVGHSERRQLFGETDALVAKKLAALLQHAITPVVCVGETLAQRDAGETESVVATQLDGALAGLPLEQLGRIVVAYEPVWAIGTGKTASAGDAQHVHAFLRARLRSHGGGTADAIRIVYGGSVKADNAAELLAQADIDGALVGGASLDAEAFARIIHAAS